MIHLHPCSIFLLAKLAYSYRLLDASSSGSEVGVQEGVSYADASGWVYLNHSLEEVNSMGVQ